MCLHICSAVSNRTGVPLNGELSIPNIVLHPLPPYCHDNLNYSILQFSHCDSCERARYFYCLDIWSWSMKTWRKVFNYSWTGSRIKSSGKKISLSVSVLCQMFSVLVLRFCFTCSLQASSLTLFLLIHPCSVPWLSRLRPPVLPHPTPLWLFYIPCSSLLGPIVALLYPLGVSPKYLSLPIVPQSFLLHPPCVQGLVFRYRVWGGMYPGRGEETGSSHHHTGPSALLIDWLILHLSLHTIVNAFINQ